VFGFDVQMPTSAGSTATRAAVGEDQVHPPRTGEKLEYSTNHDYDPVSQIALIRIYYAPVGEPGPTRVVKLSQRKFFPAELEALLAASGFAMVERYGDFLGTPLGPASETQAVVCQPRAPIASAPTQRAPAKKKSPDKKKR